MSDPSDPSGADGARDESAGPSPGLKFALDFGPLLLFFVVYLKFEIFWATGALMVAVTVALVVSRRLEGRWPLAPLVTAVLVLVFGGLTLALKDDAFIKHKPTVLYTLFAAVLGAGLLIWKRSLVQPLLGSALEIDDEGWRILTGRFALFFLVMAGLNELVLAVKEDWWAAFKTFGGIILMFGFMMSQMGLLSRHSTAPTEES